MPAASPSTATPIFVICRLQNGSIRGGQTGHNLVGGELVVDGDIDLQRFSAQHIRFRDLDLGGALSLADTDAEHIDLRGASVPELRVDDLAAYTVKTDADTWVGEVREGYGLPDDPDLTEQEQEFVDAVYDRPRLPVDRRDGVLFSDVDLGKDVVLDAERYGLLGSLQQKGVIQEIADEQYALVSRQYA